MFNTLLAAMSDTLAAIEPIGFWASLIIVVGLRLLSMWAFDEKAIRRFPYLRYANPNYWVLFRALSLPAAVVLAVLGFGNGSHGHGVGCTFYAIVAFQPTWFKHPYLAACFRRAQSATGMLLVFVVPALLVGIACFLLQTENTPHVLRFGYSLQAVGNVLMVAGFTAMMTNTWGLASAGSWHYLSLATLWDIVLLAGVSLLYLGGQPVGEFVIFEICIILTEITRWIAKVHETRVLAKSPA